jgi:hypothetical protein
VDVMKAIRDVYAKGPFQGYWRIAQASGGHGFQGGPQACVVYRLMPVDGLAGDLSESQPEQKASGGPGSSVFAETVFARGGPLPMTCGVWTSRTFERPEARCI